MWLGEFDVSAIVDFKFTTRNTTGAPTTLAGTPAISVYKSNSTTESTSGVTLTVDFDSRTGMNHVRIDTSSDGTFYATANEFQIVITTGTVGGTSVVGEVVAHFSLRNRASLKPTTAGRTLDVSATGEAGLDWANIGSPTTTVALTGTTIAVTQKVDVDTIKTNPVVNAGTITFPAGATLASTTNITAGTISAVGAGGIAAASFAVNAIDSAAIAASAVTELQTGLATATELAAVKAKTDLINTASFWAGAFTIDSTKVYADAIAGSVVKEIADNSSGGGGAPTAADIAAAMFTVNTGETYASADANSVVKQIADNAVGSGSVIGPGSIAFTVALVDTMTNPLDGAEVWVSTDEAGSNVIAGTLHTDAFGIATFMLDAGTYYFWVSHSGYNGENPFVRTVA